MLGIIKNHQGMLIINFKSGILNG
ncbi:uncharacterized protein METZ01_LOCUS121572 [marine metagenome]|uniref:Uncharacterized protein n=1 Tax=marine metagenome TaxID=408172 RepID=A0A381XVG1_9ZZZZ